MLVPVSNIMTASKDEEFLEREKLLKANERFYDRNVVDWEITNPYRVVRILDMAINGIAPESNFNDDEIDLWSQFRKILTQNDCEDEFFDTQKAEKNDDLDEIIFRLERRKEFFQRAAEKATAIEVQSRRYGKADGLESAICTVKSYKADTEEE